MSFLASDTIKLIALEALSSRKVLFTATCAYLTFHVFDGADVKLQWMPFVTAIGSFIQDLFSEIWRQEPAVLQMLRKLFCKLDFTANAERAYKLQFSRRDQCYFPGLTAFKRAATLFVQPQAGAFSAILTFAGSPALHRLNNDISTDGA